MKTYTLVFIGHFVALVVLANLFFYINVTRLGAALHTAFWSCLGFTLVTNFITGLFEDKKFGLLIEVYHLVVFLVGAVIILCLVIYKVRRVLRNVSINSKG